MNSPAPAACAPAPAYLDRLNAAQREAVEYGVRGNAGRDIPGPLLVIAGAGSGKTNTLAHRVAHLIANGADPGRILLLTFSRRAADEMGRRVQRILAQVAVDTPWLAQATLQWSGTFHGIGARLLREYAGRIGLDPAFTIHDREDSADLMNLARHEAGLSTRNKRFPLKGTCLAIYSAAVNTRAPLAEVLQTTFPWCAEWEAELKTLFRAYVQAKQAQQVLDYDDLLLYWAHMVAEPALGAEIGGLFQHVLVDEYQDTNHLQAEILLAMKPDGRGLTVVGDDAQSIYAFRGATIRNILDFPARFEPPAHRVTLEQNYRSTRPILDAANAVIAQAAERYSKDLWSLRESTARPQLVSVRDDADQSAFVVERVLARREQGIKLKQQAVLFRAASHSARLEMELTRRNIPFVKFGGLKFLEAAHVKDMLAVLRWVENLRDRVSGFRVVQLLAGIGPKTAGKVLDHVVAAPEGCELLAEQPVPEAARADWQAFSTLIEHLRRPDAPWPASFELACRWYEGQMPRLYDDAVVRQGDIQQLGRIAATYPSRQRFLTELTLDPPSATSDEAGVPLLDEDYLILSTMHSAKGQEWNSVSVLNVVDGCVPSDIATRSSAEIEEERRLLYVAMTRAKDHLELLVPQRFYVSQQQGMGDRHVYAGRTRFIPNRLLPQFEQVSWPEPPPEFRGTPQSRQAALDLAAKMRGMWD
ncbi:ATP-dependent DNA helicase [Azoarcus olearius]|uniref:ATP-dependent helicase n=1 Tax=Azoarcus sp. (strain BH72) TaxID=418699 RepID=UPI0008061790|nr:ATP-dependent helicase [Azoarcus olearius]ANQ83434.1 ATP-dependent DNA helicase [Azoarcus olearius]